MPTRPAEDCYAYVRGYYNVPAYIGVRVKAGSREGVIVKAASNQHYVHIWLDGDSFPGLYHPTDNIEYLVGQAQPLRSAPQRAEP